MILALLLAGCQAWFEPGAQVPALTLPDGQDQTQASGLAQERYVAIDYAWHAELLPLSALVSIDRVDGGTCYAYGSDEQLGRLAAEGWAYRLLPHPGKNPDARMGLQAARAKGSWDAYPTYAEYVGILRALAATYPDLCRLHLLGTTTNTVRPHELWALQISDNVGVEEAEPEVFLSSTMHGDETTGFVVLLRLAAELLDNYASDEQIRALVDGLEIWINPLANPDGTYFGGDHTVGNAIRGYTTASGSYAGVDPNRDFPYPLAGGLASLAQAWRETQAMVAFGDSMRFVLGANIHGGAELLNYPYDYMARRHVDEAWLAALSRAYAEQAQADGPAGYLTELDDGVTHGWSWYPAYGTRGDWATYWAGSREVTIEISDRKNPPASDLPLFWQANRRALLGYLAWAFVGVHGLVTDAAGLPLDARVAVVGLDSELDRSAARTDPEVGDFHRLLLPGTYDLRVTASGYRPVTVSGVVVAEGQGTTLDPIVLDAVSDAGTDSDTDSDGQTDQDGDTDGAASGCGDAASDCLWLDLEQADGGLQAGGAPVPGWAWGEAELGAHSGRRAWATGLSGPYPHHADWTLDWAVTVPLGGRLSFWQRYACEARYDGGQLLVSTDAGATYGLLTPIGGYPQASVSALAGPGWSGASAGWQLVTVDLADWSEQAVVLRWRFASDYSVDGAGWALDDLRLAPAR